MTNTTSRDPLPRNAYALPDGRIVSLHDHCTAPVERFQLADGSFVMAVRCDPNVDDGGYAAWKQAVEIEARRVRLGIQGR